MVSSVGCFYISRSRTGERFHSYQAVIELGSPRYFQKQLIDAAMEGTKKHYRTFLYFIVLFAVTRISKGRALYPITLSTNTLWNDNFDEILKLFNNQFIHTFHYNAFESVTKGKNRNLL